MKSSYSLSVRKYIDVKKSISMLILKDYYLVILSNK